MGNTYMGRYYIYIYIYMCVCVCMCVCVRVCVCVFFPSVSKHINRWRQIDEYKQVYHQDKLQDNIFPKDKKVYIYIYMGGACVWVCVWV